MAKKDPTRLQEEAFEMIELAINDIEDLAEAFDTIAEVCETSHRPYVSLDEAEISEEMIN